LVQMGSDNRALKGKIGGRKPLLGGSVNHESKRDDLSSSIKERGDRRKKKLEYKF